MTDDAKVTVTKAGEVAPVAEATQSANQELALPHDPNVIKAMEMLPPDMQELALEESTKLNAMNPNSVMMFGTRAQSGLNQAIDPILSRTAVKDVGPVGEKLVELVRTAREIDPSVLQRSRGLLAKLPFGNSFDKFVSRYQKVGEQMEEIAHQLESHLNQMRTDIALMEQLYEHNKQFRKNLLVYIAAGEVKLSELRREWEELAEKAATSHNPEDAQAVADMSDAVTRLERRVYDMKTTALISLQAAPQIRLIQATDQGLAEKIQSSIHHAIPLWKTQMGQALTLNNLRKATNYVNEVSNAVDDMLAMNADMLHKGAVEASKAAERPIVSLEKVQYAQQELIRTIDEVIQIQQEARKKRAEGELEIERLTQELGMRLVQVQQQALPR